MHCGIVTLAAATYVYAGITSLRGQMAQEMAFSHRMVAQADKETDKLNNANFQADCKTEELNEMTGAMNADILCKRVLEEMELREQELEDQRKKQEPDLEEEREEQERLRREEEIAEEEQERRRRKRRKIERLLS